MERPDPYAILGVRPDAGPEETRRAWRALASRYHPDRFVDRPPEEQIEAEAHAAVVNAAYDEIRSGRARRARPHVRPDDPAPGTSGFGSGPGFHQGSGFDSGTGFDPGARAADDRAGGGGDPWIDPLLFAQGVRLIEERRRRARAGSRWRLAALVAAVVVGALLLHLSFSRHYGYDVVHDGRGNTYEDVDCGSGYDRGRSTADALREQAATSPDPGALRYEADVVEEVCGDWAELLVPIALVSLPSLGFAVWWVFFRRRTPRAW